MGCRYVSLGGKPTNFMVVSRNSFFPYNLLGGSVAHLSKTQGIMTSPYISQSSNQQFCLVFWLRVDCISGTCDLKVHIFTLSSYCNIQNSLVCIDIDDTKLNVSYIHVNFTVSIFYR